MTGGLGKLSRYLLAGASAIGMLAIGNPEARATDVQQLEQTLLAVQEQVRELQREVASAKAAAASAQSTAARAASGAGGGGEDIDLKIKWRGAPEFSSADGQFKFKLRGRVDADFNHINQDTTTTFAPDVSGTAIRRARLGFEGVAFYDVKYVLEADFAENAVSLNDAYIQYTGLPVAVTLGNFKTPNSLEEMMSANYITFMERAAFVEAFGLTRQIGAGLSYNAEYFTLAAGIFGAAAAPSPLFNPGFGNPAFVGNETKAFAARGTVAPINREVNGVNQVLHFGASIRERESGNGEPFLQYQARAADLFLANRLVNTNRVGDSDRFWGLEAAGVWGPLSVQGEYTELQVDLPGGSFIRNTSTAAANGLPVGNPFVLPPTPTRANPFIGVPNPTYSGWYADASLFLTGETRPYKDGVFQRVKVKNPVTWSKGGGWGAWQIAGRFDVLDLSDSAFNTALASPVSNFTGGCTNTTVGVNVDTGANPVRIAQCGQQETWLVGVNWYLNDYVRLMFNYTESELSSYPITTVTENTSGVPTGTDVKGFDGAKIRGFGARAHVDW